MSATINCKEFADYFAVPVQNKMNPAYVFEVEGMPHSIEEYYLNDLEHIYHNGVCWNALFVTLSGILYFIRLNLCTTIYGLKSEWRDGRERVWRGIKKNSWVCCHKL